MDITYIPVQRGYLYLVAIIDLYSRCVVGWSLSNTMESEWCRQALEAAVEQHGKPEIINTDQGSQFTAELFANYATKDLKVKLSMDGKGRAIDMKNRGIRRFSISSSGSGEPSNTSMYTSDQLPMESNAIVV